MAVHDLGQQHLKDVQHEHIYELTIDERDVSPKPLKTDAWITAYVESKLEEAFEKKTRSWPPQSRE